jgi:hypothetical protein
MGDGQRELLEDDTRQGIVPQTLADVQDFDAHHMTIRVKIRGHALCDIPAIRWHGLASLNVEGICFRVIGHARS